jgi:hypothetical protein
MKVISDTGGDCVFEELDREITEAEITTAIKKLKTQKKSWC